MSRSYSELSKLSTFLERFEYLKLGGVVGEETFGSKRYLNQAFYTSKEWRRARDLVILRDNGCDMGVEGADIHGKIYIHHMNPITYEDIVRRRDSVLDPGNLICVSMETHEAIHYGDAHLLPCITLQIRMPNDTCLW